MGLGWISKYGSGKGNDVITSGVEGVFNANPTEWDNGYFDLLLGYEWELTKVQPVHIFGMVKPKEEDPPRCRMPPFVCRQ